MQRRANTLLPLGRQLREARRCARLNASELAKKAGVSTSAIYNVERLDRRGRTLTLITLARALGLKLRVPNLSALAKDRGLTAAKLAAAAKISFDTVRSILSNPMRGNVRSFERVCAALNHPVNLVI